MTPLHSHQTKIVATIGPASSSQPVLERMIRAGMNVARLNFSHGEFETHRANIEALRAASGAVDIPIAIMADLSGPKMRIGKFDVEKIELAEGDTFTLSTEQFIGNQERVSISFKDLPAVVSPGDALSLNDGYIQLEVISVAGPDVTCRVIVGGELRAKKGLNLPGIALGMSAFTERDRECLKFAFDQGVDAISQSFVENAADINIVRKTAHDMGYDPFLIAKIERASALERLDEILAASDGLMIARGDLGVEVPIERIAVLQKDIIKRANRAAKPVITATQMLESMITYRLPTRAEATDVSNAILDGTDAVMLSGESAMGAYPVEAIAMLAKIARTVEPTRRPRSSDRLPGMHDASQPMLPEHLIAVSIEASLEHLHPAAVFVPSATGGTARRLASLHLPVRVIAISSNEKTLRDLLFSYGTAPVHTPSLLPVWRDFVREYIAQHQLKGDFAILTGRTPPHDPHGDHQMEIINL